MTGQQILNYKITRFIGSGGMAKVYEGEHVNLGTKVAIKILDPVLASKGNIKDRFRNEARIMASLKHENIVQVLDYYEDDNENIFAIIMELLEGDSLSDFVRQNGKLSKELVYDIMSKTLRAFDYAHKKGLIHRDVKPANLFITKDKNIKILDFGIAKIIGQDSELTSTGMQMGTPMFMSPEQVKDSKHIDQRSDIYSLGVMMYFMLSGKSPYDTNTNSNFDILSKIVNEQLPSLSKYPDLSKIIQKATAKDPDERYLDCNTFLADLENIHSKYQVDTGIEQQKSTKKNSVSNVNDFLYDTLPYLKSLSEKLSKRNFIDKLWQLNEGDWEYQTLIFKKDKSLMLSKQGKGIMAKWDYLADANVLQVIINGEIHLFSNEFINNDVWILKKTGTDKDYVCLSKSNSDKSVDINEYLKLLKLRKQNIKSFKLKDGSSIEIQILEGKRYFDKGNKIFVNDKPAYDGTYILNNNVKIEVKQGKIINATVKKAYKTKGGEDVLIEVNCYSYGYNKGDDVWINGTKAKDGKYKIKGERNFVVKEGKVTKLGLDPTYEAIIIVLAFILLIVIIANIK